MNGIKNFIKINRQICNRIENILPIANPDITNLYSQVVSDYANKKKRQLIADIGGGRDTPFAKYLNTSFKHKLIVIDIDKNELEENEYADEIIVADVNKQLPLKQKSVDLIVSRYVFEHLNSIPDFISNSEKLLKNGGYFIHLLSCKYAFFALLNQVLPNQITKFLLNTLIPDSHHIHGFKTNYDHCYYDAIINVFTKKGFSIEKIYLSYYGSRYFNFFIPFYLISITYEIIIQVLGLKNLCAYILIVSKKNGD